MHGRLKVKTTAEQAEAKRLERDKKLALFKKAMKLTFHKRAVGELDTELLRVTGGVLSANPDVYTLWNIRREVYLHLSKSCSESDLQSMCIQELEFIVTCLRVNPKSYGCWHQRVWVLNHMPSPDWKNELSLCNKFLEYDERNFHCWDYRRFVVQKAHIPAEQELEFTTKKIASNFSNYSSWHYRSKLLLQLHGCHGDAELGHSRRVLKEEALLKEFEIVQNAFFTDPDDQSAWFYQRWLLGKGETKLEIQQAVYSCQSRCLVVALTKPICISSKKQTLQVLLDDTLADGEWSSPCNSLYSHVWTFTHSDDITASRVHIHLVSNGDVLSDCSIDVTEQSKDVFVSCSCVRSSQQFRMGLTDATNTILTSELDSCLQLHELEPDNKWALLTVVLLMRTLDYHQYEADITSNLRKLEELDPKRCAYYQDLASRFTIEHTLTTTKGTNSLSLAGRQLTSLYHASHMTFFHEINLSNNRLTSVKNFNFFLLVEKLNIDDNEIDSLDGLVLPRLKELSVRNNHLPSISSLSSLTQCPQLSSLDVQGNPLCEQEDYQKQLGNIFTFVR